MVEQCKNCNFYADFTQYGACFNAKSEFCCEFTEPDHSCPQWSKKEMQRHREKRMTDWA